MKTRRLKVVSYLVLLTMVVSLFAPLGTMKKVMANGTSFVYSGGQWYAGEVAPENVISNILESIQEAPAAVAMLTIEDHPQDAFLSLGEGDLKVGYIGINVDPGSDYVIPDHIQTFSLSISYEPSSTGTYFYNGDLENAFLQEGNLSITGNVQALKITSLYNLRKQLSGKLEITGDVESAEWYRKTEAIPASEYIPGYGETEMNQSIARCGLAESKVSFFMGDFSLKGTITNLKVKELYYDANLDEDVMLTKKMVNSYTTPAALTPILVDGVLSLDIPEANISSYSTTEWMEQYQNMQAVTYNVYYDGTSYSWTKTISIEGLPAGVPQAIAVGPDNFPVDVDLNNATVRVFGTANEGLSFPGGMNLGQLEVMSGIVTVQENVTFLFVEDNTRTWINPGSIDVHVQGDVQILQVSRRRDNTNVTIDGTVSYGGVYTGYNNQSETDVFASFTKAPEQSAEIIINGAVNPDLKLCASEDMNEVYYSMEMSLADFEDAVGITTENRTKVFDGKTAYATAGVEVYMDILDNDRIQTIEDEVTLEDGFHLTNKAVDIQIGTFYSYGYDTYPGANVTSTLAEVPFSVNIPDYNADCNYGIVRVHENGDGTTRYDVIDSTVTDGVISFSSDLFSKFVIISDEVIIPQDYTAPVLSAGAFDRTSHTEGTATFTSTEAGEFFYEVVAKGEAEPEIDTDNDGEACVMGSNSIVDPYGMEEGAMDLYIKVKDASGNVSDALKIEMAEYNSLPSFENSTVSINCSSTSSGLDITDYLAAIDNDNDQTLTWTMKQAPSHGKLTMTNATALSGGVNLIVDGSIVYQPDKNYCGTDQFVIEVSDGKATADCQVTMNVTDQTAPTGTIKEESNEWKTFLNTITFGLFFKNTVNVSIEAADDGGSGLDTIEYCKSATALTLEQVQALTDWTAYTTELSISPVDKEQFIIYSKITDHAGNISYICSDGMEFDLTGPSTSSNYQKGASSMEVSVTDVSGVDTVTYSIDGDASQTAVLTNGKFTIPSLKEGRYNVVVTATDMLGNSSSKTIPVVSLYTVKFYLVEGAGLAAINTQIVEYGDDATAPTGVKRNGYEFVGWNKIFQNVITDLNVYADWRIVTPYVGTYDGTSHNLISVTATLPGDVVTYSTDGATYASECPSATAAGNYPVYVKIERQGLPTWISTAFTAKIAPKAITLAMISEIPTVEFNGEHFCPVPVVKDGAVTLVEGTDYTLSYTNNRNSGIAFVNVIGMGNYSGTVQAPFRILEKKGEVKIKDKETPQVTATNLNKLYEDETLYTPEDRQIEENGGSVKLELAVQTQVVSVPDQTKIKQMAKDKKIGLFLDISLFKVVQQAGATTGSTSQITHTNQLLSIVIPIPNELKGRKGIELYRVHNGVPSVIPVGAENAIDGEYCTIDSKNITLYVQNFSTYAIGYSTSSITSPKTGEESSQLPWILLGLGLAAAGVVVLKKSRRVRISK